MAYQQRQVLYSASKPIDGAATMHASYSANGDDQKGIVPYFVSCVHRRRPGPLYPDPASVD